MLHELIHYITYLSDSLVELNRPPQNYLLKPIKDHIFPSLTLDSVAQRKIIS